MTSLEPPSPATGQVLARYRVDDAEAVDTPVRRARAAADRWAGWECADRRRRLLRRKPPVFAGRRTAAALADRPHTGVTSINGVQTFAFVPSLPFGGAQRSGLGRIHGTDGLREFARPEAISRQRFRSPVNLMSFARTDRYMSTPMLLTRSLHKRG
jgi:acyl-CoA reductase-like NAD-dependent aldehyde dehydrogenase